ncbi:hypothetical protein KS4_23250 [Poriferisphaera corsica]|uniref:Uncharacterized protein n=1 Tax=Poriferisphaera corsica TaxID=2528020 RepID=A0A517YVL2_9BACT|nr:hypothetical protein KS4_23250 [Poriferisphaera corsica]
MLKDSEYPELPDYPKIAFWMCVAVFLVWAGFGFMVIF